MNFVVSSGLVVEDMPNQNSKPLDCAYTVVFSASFSAAPLTVDII